MVGMEASKSDRDSLGDGTVGRDGQTRTEKPSVESERWLRSLVENASDIMAILDDDATVRYVNPAVERVLGYRGEEVVGTSVFDYVHPEDVEFSAGSFV